MDFKKEFFKYLQYWPWFLISLILSIGAAYLFIETASPTFQTSALIYIDKKQEDEHKIITISTNQKSKEDNLEDEIMLITSNEFLLKVVRTLRLNISYFEKTYIQSKIVNELPFILKPTVSNDSLPLVSYNINIGKDGFNIVNSKTKQHFTIRGFKEAQSLAGLPFTVELTANAKKNISLYLDKEYVVKLEPTAIALKKLKESLEVLPDENSKGTLALYHNGISPERSRKILQEVIILLDENIVNDKQKLFINTVSFLDQRIKDFAKEKDSIESVKEKYLQNNDILVLDKYIVDKTNEKNSKKESSILNEKQIGLTKFAINDIKNADPTSALGTDYKLEAPTVNQLLLNYNKSILESELILQRAQKNNPAYLNLVTQLKIQKEAILNTLDGYLNFLKQNNVAYQSEEAVANSEAKSIPTKDKILGNINNNLIMKEETYTVLLQKREEAILNGAVLESNLRTLNSPETNYSPIFPQPSPFFLGAFLFGLLVPFSLIYVRFLFDTKIHNEDDVQNKIANGVFLGTIPKIDSKEKFDNSANSRSMIAEATRTLFSNISFLLPQKEEGKGFVLLFSSSIQGEGKTFCAFHNAITISNLNKKVLLIGADLRNPQLDIYFNIDKNSDGLSTYLSSKNEDWKTYLKKKTDFSSNLDLLLSGKIPPNPTQLLTNTNFDQLIQEAKQLYDFIIIDSAPVQLVSDTLNISHLADVTVFITRSNFSEKKTLLSINDFIEKGQLKNLGIVINGVNSHATQGYNYGYNYHSEKSKKKWFKKKQA